MHVQYGCGWSAPERWLNFDSSMTLRFERIPILGRMYVKNNERFPRNVRYGDVTKGLPISDNTCDGVYASHVLEHLTREDIETALLETLRILRPGGIFRAVVPDLELIAREYIQRLDSGAHDASDFFMDETMLGQRSRRATIQRAIFEALRTSAHFWMWDYQSLASLFSSVGFTSIRRASYNDSSDIAFKDVESEHRFERALAIEAIKPAY